MPESATTSPPTSTGDGATHSSETSSASAAPVEFRYQAGEGIPDSLVGKTAAEAAELFNQMHRTVMSAQQQYQQQQAQAQQAQQTQQTSYDYSQRDAVLGAQSRAIAEIRYPNDFKRWGPEIDMALTQIPASNRTPEVMEWIVNGVRGRHANELASEAADLRVKTLLETGQLRPQGQNDGTGAGPAFRVDMTQLPPRYAAVLQNLGVTSEKVDDFLRKAYPQMPIAQARDKWFKLASKGDVLTDGKGFRYDEEGQD